MAMKSDSETEHRNSDLTVVLAVFLYLGHYKKFYDDDDDDRKCKCLIFFSYGWVGEKICLRILIEL